MLSSRLIRFNTQHILQVSKELDRHFYEVFTRHPSIHFPLYMIIFPLGPINYDSLFSIDYERIRGSIQSTHPLDRQPSTFHISSHGRCIHWEIGQRFSTGHFRLGRCCTRLTHTHHTSKRLNAVAHRPRCSRRASRSYPWTGERPPGG